MKQIRHFLATAFLFLAVKSEPEWIKSLMIHNEPIQPPETQQPVVEGGETNVA